MGAFDGELPLHEAESTPAGQALTTKEAARFGLGRPARDLVADLRDAGSVAQDGCCTCRSLVGGAFPGAVTHAARRHCRPLAAVAPHADV
ncbi:hypothetical protein GCM10010215_19230 [Streptomyces virginiae]|uniref:Uncharacterized protein n=1 Tax=Streptomyces virginiae TaxID=1961 RepID=A0ABQ3NR47_STRVG|nr:hypothetical protein GCM10010215_19230 [Streptomyces virginiae]GHI15197.1 hypothetical protein Scinn_46600 [Streptomyces virginiae]GLV92226.1 hypothetical protein Slala04_36800 [Streptomyces lavendulae subsp. lavendulae]